MAEDSKNRISEHATETEGAALARRTGAGLPVRQEGITHVSVEQLAVADKVKIEGLTVFANHGVYPEEHKLGQKFRVSAVLYCDTRRAGETDDIDAAIDYGAVCHDIDAFMRAHTFKLIERAAEALAAYLLDRYPMMLGLRLTIEKPWAPIGLPVDSVAVEIERVR